jgi:hypothetical protein
MVLIRLPFPSFNNQLNPLLRCLNTSFTVQKLKRGKQFPTKPIPNTRVKNWKDKHSMANVIITVIQSPYRKGYSLEHNQSNGWKGINGTIFGWYKNKSDAEVRAKELNELYNR